MFAIGAMVLLAACSRQPDDTTAEGTLEIVVDALRASATDHSALERVFDRIDLESQRRLAERAGATTGLGGREHQAWEMIVDGRAVLRLGPRLRSYRARRGAQEGEAIVTVTGTTGEQAEIPMRWEEGRWRVVLEIPQVRSAQ